MVAGVFTPGTFRVANTTLNGVEFQQAAGAAAWVGDASNGVVRYVPVPGQFVISYANDIELDASIDITFSRPVFNANLVYNFANPLLADAALIATSNVGDIYAVAGGQPVLIEVSWNEAKTVATISPVADEWDANTVIYFCGSISSAGSDLLTLGVNEGGWNQIDVRLFFPRDELGDGRPDATSIFGTPVGLGGAHNVFTAGTNRTEELVLELATRAAAAAIVTPNAATDYTVMVRIDGGTWDQFAITGSGIFIEGVAGTGTTVTSRTAINLTSLLVTANYGKSLEVVVFVGTGTSLSDPAYWGRTLPAAPAS
jgi:hypothetical protein